MNIVITESAADDIADGYLFYEQQFLGLGAYFEASIFADLKSLIIYAGVHQTHFDIYHRKISAKFPYAIYYTIEDNAIRIYAVADTRRDPTLLEGKLANFGS